MSRILPGLSNAILAESGIEMFNYVKRIAVSAFSECVGDAIVQGATLAEGTITAIRNGWNGASEQTRQKRVDDVRKWLRDLPEDWQNVMDDMAKRRAERNGQT